MLFEYLFIAFAFVLSLYLYFTRTFNVWKSRNVNGPKPIAFFGNLKASTLRQKTMGEVLSRIYSKFPKEKVVGIYRMTSPCLILRDLDVIKHVMIKDFEVFQERGVQFSTDSLGMNLFHADSEPWQILRGKFTPLFTSQKLKNMLHLIDERGDRFMDYMMKITSGNIEQNAYTVVQKYTLATFTACAFGMDIEIKHNMDQFNKIDKYIFTPTYAAELDMMYPGIFRKLKRSLFPIILTSFFKDLVKSIIEQRGGKPTNRNDFMDTILQLRQEGQITGMKRFNDKELSLELTDDIIAAQAFVFYAAGYETSATTMTSLLHQLAFNPDVQDKLIAEIDDVLYRNGGKITYECLNELPYLEKVFDETLRLFPIVDPVQRKASRDYNVPEMDLVIKKDEIVLVSVLGIHHDEKYYPDPLKFDPERFSPENSKMRHPCAYLPFGVGPRNCIGMRFAKVQSRVCIVKLLSKFRVEPSKNTKENITYDPYRVVLGPLGGMPLNFVPRL